MDRRTFLEAGAAVGVGGVVGCAAPSSGTAFRDGFEDGIDDWTSDAAIGPEVNVADFEWEVDVSTEEAFEGERSLRIRNEGSYDDGTTWAGRSLPVEPGRAYTATVTARYWSESESFNTLRDAVMRLGPEPPESEADFPNPGVNTTALGETPYGGLREPLWLAAGWREYRFEWTTPRLSTDTLHVALGTSVIWEGDATHFVDDLSVALRPR
ncbi:hypothetical protein C2R22_18435 [Salinigranum rubrum]|uniref:CBM-cenC domain-containing protein n=1 Tax=Salinigranum rubrum TaxID=755307 RepID=A0A2I8VN64_9EURY|nr:hypothetical protein [Salinigranum rubrum]AUV83377.1 hypothetical protein C2R22_18435 [Salinigranum rubrum]